MRLFIKNSTIVDGTGKPGYAGGILLDGKRIAAMGRTIAGKSSTPGVWLWLTVLLTHSHSDREVLRNPA